MPRLSHLWIVLYLLTASAVHAQDINGDLSTNIGAGSNVDSNNNTENVTYNGSQGALSNPVPTAMAPTVMGGGGNDSCLIPSSKGFQVSLFGLAEGTMQQDVECNRRKDARLMGAPQTIGGLGLQVSGISVMCSNARVFRAMALANTPCPIMDVSTGRLLIGRDAFEKYRSNPSLFVVGYRQDTAFWNAILLIGKDLPDVEASNRNQPSLSYRFRRSGERNNQRPSNSSERPDGSGESVTDTGSGS